MTEPALHDLIDGLREGFQDHLRSVVLYGSAAGDAQRAVSDTNVVVLLSAVDPARLEAARAAITLARVALRLRVMLLLPEDLPAAAEHLTVKVADILRRRRVLYGEDPFAALVIPRHAAIAQLRQSLLHQTLRLREAWLEGWDAARTCAEAAGGLRACAAQLLALEGTPAPSAREALITIAGDPLADLSAARDGQLEPASAEVLRQRLLEVTAAMRRRAEGLA
jgi:hypothetical protein